MTSKWNGWGPPPESAADSDKVKISTDDTTPGFLLPKLDAGAGVNLVEKNPSGNEQVTINTISEADQQPIIVPAGAFTPKSTNSIAVYVQKEFTGADTRRFTVLEFEEAGTDEWFAEIDPPKNWTSGKLKFIAEYLITAVISATPGTIIFELGVDATPDNFDPDATTYQTITVTDTPADDTIPKIGITAESAELTITGGIAAAALGLRIKKTGGTESGSVFLAKIKVVFV